MYIISTNSVLSCASSPDLKTHIRINPALVGFFKKLKSGATVINLIPHHASRMSSGRRSIFHRTWNNHIKPVTHAPSETGSRNWRHKPKLDARFRRQFFVPIHVDLLYLGYCITRLYSSTQVLKYSIRYSIEYFSNKLLDSGSPNVRQQSVYVLFHR